MDWITPQNWWLAFCILFAAGMFEYLFPPVPGDSAMLFGFFLVGRGDLPLWLAFSAAFAGSTLGAVLAYRVGYRLGRRYFFLRSRGGAGSVRQRLEGWFSRYGARIVAVNRFLPGVRAFFLFLAGMKRLPFLPVVVYATISNLGFLLMFAFLGTRIGEAWEDVQDGFRAGFLVFGTLLLASLVTWALMMIRLRREPVAEA